VVKSRWSVVVDAVGFGPGGPIESRALCTTRAGQATRGSPRRWTQAAPRPAPPASPASPPRASRRTRNRARFGAVRSQGEPRAARLNFAAAALERWERRRRWYTLASRHRLRRLHRTAKARRLRVRACCAAGRREMRGRVSRRRESAAGKGGEGGAVHCAPARLRRDRPASARRPLCARERSEARQRETATTGQEQPDASVMQFAPERSSVPTESPPHGRAWRQALPITVCACA